MGTEQRTFSPSLQRASTPGRCPAHHAIGAFMEVQELLDTVELHLLRSSTGVASICAEVSSCSPERDSCLLGTQSPTSPHLPLIDERDLIKNSTDLVQNYFHTICTSWRCSCSCNFPTPYSVQSRKPAW